MRASILYSRILWRIARQPATIDGFTSTVRDKVAREIELLNGRWYEVRDYPASEQGTIAMMIDTTERKQIERFRKTQREELEDLVQARTQALVDAQEEAFANERMAAVGRLASTVSH